MRGSPYSNRKPYLSAVSARGPLPTMFKPTLFSRARSINLNLRAWRRDARAISLGIHESAQYAANQYRDILQAAAITQSMDQLGFQSAEEALHRRIVPAIRLAAHIVGNGPRAPTAER